jgi:hypothetical protein
VAVFVFVDETLQLGLDCVALLSARRIAILGWAMTPRGAETGLSIAAGGAGDCTIEHVSFHPGPASVQADPQRAVVSGFTILATLPAEGTELAFTLQADAAVLRADLRDPAIETDLVKATAGRDPRANFALLRAAAEDPALRPLLGFQHRQHGAFSGWLARMPLLRGRVEHAPFAEVEALAAPSGETVAVLRLPHALPAEAEIEAVTLGWLRGADGGLGETVAPPAADRHEARLPTALVAYARAEPGWAERLAAQEVVVQLRLRGEEMAWLRLQPAPAAVPDLLDAPARAGALGEANGAGLDLLRHIAARREAAFAPSLAALASAPGGTPPRLVLVLGVDDPMTARMFRVTAEEMERRCDTLLLLGEAAEEIAADFARRGRLRALAGAEAMAALRGAAARGGLVAVDAVVFAQCIAAGRTEDAFAHHLPAGEVARLLALHAVAGCGTALSDSLARLLKLRRSGPGEGSFAAIPRAWSSRQASEAVNEHLARLWAAGAPPSPGIAEHALHV